jgi:hypothetical protein
MASGMGGTPALLVVERMSCGGLLAGDSESIELRDTRASCTSYATGHRSSGRGRCLSFPSYSACLCTLRRRRVYITSLRYCIQRSAEDNQTLVNIQSDDCFTPSG